MGRVNLLGILIIGIVELMLCLLDGFAANPIPYFNGTSGLVIVVMVLALVLSFQWSIWLVSKVTIASFLTMRHEDPQIGAKGSKSQPAEKSGKKSRKNKKKKKK